MLHSVLLGNHDIKTLRAVKSRALHALANEMWDREYCPLSPEGILFLSIERKYWKQKKKANLTVYPMTINFICLTDMVINHLAAGAFYEIGLYNGQLLHLIPPFNGTLTITVSNGTIGLSIHHSSFCKIGFLVKFRKNFSANLAKFHQYIYFRKTRSHFCCR